MRCILIAMRAWQHIRGALLAAVLLAGLVLGGLLVYWAGTLGGAAREGLVVLPTFAVPPLTTLNGTPIVRFSRVEPAVQNVLAYDVNVYTAGRVDALPNVPPVGAYLPLTGNTLFELIAPTLPPTPLPYPTTAPLPLPALAGATLPPLESPDGRTLPYVGAGCAPSGNPVQGVLTQRYHAYHLGIDIGVPLNTPVLATHSGTVTFVGWSEVGYGYLVVLQNDSFITYYAHNTSFNVTLNQRVGKGSILAWSGSTGNSTGPHVHYEVRVNDVPVDPLSFDARGYKSC